MRTTVGIALGLAFLAAMILATWRETGVHCEVCIDFEGRSACGSSTAADREFARLNATANACAVLSGGVTQGIRCDKTPPRSVRCEE